MDRRVKSKEKLNKSEIDLNTNSSKKDFSKSILKNISPSGLGDKESEENFKDNELWNTETFQL
jgi:hypothetical protein